MTTPVVARRQNIARPAAVFLVVGGCCVVVGGMVAAVTGPWELDDGSWLAAYLVLVCGVAQCAIGAAQVWLAGLPTSPALGWTQVSCWNLGNAAVIAGTLTDVPVLVDAGGALLVIALGIAVHAVRRPVSRSIGWAYPGGAGRTARQHPDRHPPGPPTGYPMIRPRRLAGRLTRRPAGRPSRAGCPRSG